MQQKEGLNPSTGVASGSYKTWDASDVADWLSDNLKLPQYGKIFEEIGVDGQIIDHVTDTDLENDFNIKLRLHRVKIIEGIKKLQSQDSGVPAPPTLQNNTSNPPGQQQQQPNAAAQQQQEQQQMQVPQPTQSNFQISAQVPVSLPVVQQQQQQPQPVVQPPIEQFLVGNNNPNPNNGIQQQPQSSNNLQQVPAQTFNNQEPNPGMGQQQPGVASTNAAGAAGAAGGSLQEQMPPQQQQVQQQPQVQQQQLQHQFGGNNNNSVDNPNYSNAVVTPPPAGINQNMSNYNPNSLINNANVNQPNGVNQPGVFSAPQDSALVQAPQQAMQRNVDRVIGAAGAGQQQPQQPRAAASLLVGVGPNQPPANNNNNAGRSEDQAQQQPQQLGQVPNGFALQQHQQLQQQQQQLQQNQQQNNNNNNQQQNQNQNQFPLRYRQPSVTNQQRVDTPPHSRGAAARNPAIEGDNPNLNNLRQNPQPNSQSSSEGLRVYVNQNPNAQNDPNYNLLFERNSPTHQANNGQNQGNNSQQQSSNDILVLRAAEGQLLNNVYIIGDNGAALGRHSASNDMVISESFVSRRHCEIKFQSQSNQGSMNQPEPRRSQPLQDGDLTHFYLRDIGSTTGTFIMVRQEIRLSSNMMFQMGLSEFKVVTTSKQCMIELHVFEGPSRNRIIPVDDLGLTIGRDPNNSLTVQEDSQMSNFHAKINYSQQKQGFFLTDVGSTNRTWLRLSAEGEQSALHPLKVGDYLKIGSTVFQVECDDIHNLQNMPVINRRASQQNNNSNNNNGNGQGSNNMVQPGQFGNNGGDLNIGGGQVPAQVVMANAGGPIDQDIILGGVIQPDDHQMVYQNNNNQANHRNNQAPDAEMLGDDHGSSSQNSPNSDDSDQMDNSESEGNMMQVDEEERKEAPVAKNQNSNNNINQEEECLQQDVQGENKEPGKGSTIETCKVCYENEADAAFIPCGHVTACIACAQRCNICPVCRTPYHDIIKIYRQ